MLITCLPEPQTVDYKCNNSSRANNNNYNDKGLLIKPTTPDPRAIKSVTPEPRNIKSVTPEPRSVKYITPETRAMKSVTPEPEMKVSEERAARGTPDSDAGVQTKGCEVYVTRIPRHLKVKLIG